ncbi:MAG: alpha/beta hydrolase [Polyangiales bacterium]
MFEGFEYERVATSGATIAVRHAGRGPAVLLLHGFPQTHVIWHAIAPRLAQHYSVVCPDLRGYGDSSKPATDDRHTPYSKRAMAQDQLALMHALGFERFAVVGHDRGGRCAYRLALDHPAHVRALSVLDIIPTYEHFQRTNAAFALGYFHWFFLAQRHDLPERLIAADPDAFFLRGGAKLFHPDALAEYRRAFHDPATIHAMCEDYRAAAGIDCELDEADKLARRRIGCPVQALWGKRSGVDRWYDVLAVWREWADRVEGHAIDCGHFLPEEAPDETYTAIKDFLDHAPP